MNLPLCTTQNRMVVFSVNKSLFARTTRTRPTFTTTTLRGSSNTSRSSVAGRFSRRSSSLNSSSALGKKMVNFAGNEADGEAEDDRDEEAFEEEEKKLCFFVLVVFYKRRWFSTTAANWTAAAKN